MIIDCHTHWGQQWEEKSSGNPAPWLAILDRNKVDRAFLMVCEGLFRQDRVVADNDHVARVAKASGGRMIPLGTACPPIGAPAVAEARRCLTTLGMPGLKFHPWVQGFSVADKTFHEICALAGDLKKPIFFHDGTPCYCLSEQIGGLARMFPKTVFVLGHSGILWNWRSALEAVRFPNVWSCLCGPHYRAMELLCQRADSDRLLWGSDFGFGMADPIGYRLGLFMRTRISDTLREKILDHNPRRLTSNP
ncbi:MAG: amidohydrolase [Lentisphaerae bacterium]|nr:amidohydrolase [Lentisphaerota bacterium]